MKPNLIAPDPGQNVETEEAPVSVVSVLFGSRKWERREIRPGVFLLVPPNIIMPEPSSEPVWFSNPWKGGTMRDRCQTFVDNVQAVITGNIPEAKPFALQDWRYNPESETEIEADALFGSLIRDPKVGLLQPQFAFAPIVAIAPAEGWALGTNDWIELVGDPK